MVGALPNQPGRNPQVDMNVKENGDISLSLKFTTLSTLHVSLAV